MTPTLTHTLEIGGEYYASRLTVPQIAELERKLDTPAGALFARLMRGVYLQPDDTIAYTSVLEAGFMDRDIGETIFHALVGGGMDAGRARQLVTTYVEGAPRQLTWPKAADVMRVYMVGFTPPKKPEAPKRGRSKKPAATDE